MENRVLGIETEFAHIGREEELNRAPDGFLPNGGRFYIDCQHPEYATPECAGPKDLVAYDKAGELIASALVQGKIYKNNTDGKFYKEGDGMNANSYGCHENYLIDSVSDGDFQHLIERLIPFLVTRQLFTGAGGGLLDGKGNFVVSPRSNFIEQLHSKITTDKRAIINLKNEPHTFRHYRRLHLILGDSNMSELATYMKMATTEIALCLIEEGLVKPPDLSNPVGDLKEIANNTKGGWKVNSHGGKSMKATDLQRVYLEAAYKGDCHKRKPEWSYAMSMWKDALDKLDEEPMELRDWVEWLNKKDVIDGYAKRYKLRKSDDRIMNLELQYTDIDRRTSVFYELQRRGRIRRLVSDREIEKAIEFPPPNTRANFRGRYVREVGYPDSIDWAGIVDRGNRWDTPDPLSSYENYLGAPERAAVPKTLHGNGMIERAKELLKS